jgi:multiple sugar transport system permease protein
MGSRYAWFIAPAVVVTIAVIIFPWMFTVYMSMHDWQVTGARTFIGLDNYLNAFRDARFLQAIGRTAAYAFFAVTMPVVLGTAAATVFHHEFPLRGLLRGIFIMPMMATPVAVALVWAMMFHPQLGVLNYLLKSIGLPPSLWVYAPGTVLPALAMVETWQWTPLVMLIVLGGLATLPVEPYESARIDGAEPWQTFLYITLPLVMPVILVAVVLRTIDALKAFDLIFTITQGGPGTASETLNIYLYLKAFSFYQIGQASAVVVIFFALIVALSLGSLYLRERTRWA